MGAASEKQWREFWERLDASGNALPLWQEVQAAYTASWRAYHNLHHIGDCLRELNAVRTLADEPIALEAAIWFHDLIYDTHRKDNEERSADLAASRLARAGKSEGFCRGLRALILATQHQSEPATNDARLLTDIDLSILGQPPELYEEFEKQIRTEYAWVTDQDFAVGRAAVLTTFLRRDQVFSTSTFALRYELQARANLAWAIDRLAT